VISGCDGWKSIHDFGKIKLEWLRKYFPYTEGIPTDDTIARIMRRLETKAFTKCFMGWIQAVSSVTNEDIIPIDGKTVRRSHDKRTNKSAIHMVSAWSVANGVVLAQEKTSEKSNEITAIPELLNVLALKGCIVTIDAMGCQEEIAQKIIKKEANYVLAVKGNQGHLHEDIKQFFETSQKNNFLNVTHDFHDEHDKGHGRLEYRQCWVINTSLYEASFRNLQKWKNVKQIFMVKTERDLGDKITKDTRFYIASCEKSAKEALNIVRSHWHIENCLHWTLDMTFNEDSSRIRKQASPENFSIVRQIALNVIKKHTSLKASVKRKRAMAALDDKFRDELIEQAF
jgi:predicted transposase YbfD/YdcC